MAIIAALVGQHVATKVIAILGRASLIIFILAATIFVSAISLGMPGAIVLLFIDFNKITLFHYFSFQYRSLMSISVPFKQVGLALHAWLERLNTRRTWDLKAYVYIKLNLQSFSIGLSI